MKYLCFDYGSRRIGIAASDPTATVVRPVTTIDCKVTPRFLDEIKKVITEESPEKLIFGLPLGPYGDETEMCAKIRTFADKILAVLDAPLPIDFMDESFSSVTTQSIMLESSSKKRRKDKKTIDRIAACVILESYLREQSGQISLY